MNIDKVDIFSDLIKDVSKILGKPISPNAFEIIDRGIPHTPPTKLPAGKTGVYTYFCPTENCFLKIGKVGTKSSARFTSQHYSPDSAKSTLAKSLLADQTMREKYNLTETNIKTWIKENCRRIDILFDVSLGKFANELCEAILHYKFEPKYEG